MNESPKPKRPLGRKLLIGASALVLAILISSFAITFPLLSEDMKSYTFELQASQAQLLGQEFSTTTEGALGTIRIIAGLLPVASDWKDGATLAEDKKNQIQSFLSNQGSIKQFEIFHYKDPASASASVYSWNTETPTTPPISVVLELINRGVAYSAKLNKTDLDLNFYFTEKPASLDPPPPLFVIRAKLNTANIVRKSKGMYAQVLDMNGQILFDTRTTDSLGTKIDPQFPLFSAAKNSLVGVGTLEFKDPGNQESILGAYVLPGFNVLVMSAIRKVDAFRGTYQLIETLAVSGVGLLGLSLILVVFFSMGLTGPIAALTNATHTIASGNFELRLDEKSDDEIGILSRSMNSMSTKIQELLLDSIEKVRIEQEVAIASTLQQNLIPEQTIERPQYALYSNYSSAAECGGDWWGYVETKDYLSVIIADATGHGLPAAMLTASARGCFSAIQKLLNDFPEVPSTPGFLLTYANRAILESTRSELNMTMFILTYAFKDGAISYANAGHNPPWHMKLTKPGEPMDFKSLMGRGSRLGEEASFETPKTHTSILKPGERIFLYTDGLIENKNETEVDYGKERIKELLLSNYSQTGQELSKTIKADLDLFYKTVPPADDVTYIILEPRN